MFSKAGILLLLSFFFTVTLVATVSMAQLSLYSVDADVAKDGRTKVKLSITFKQPTEQFNFLINARVSNFNASSTSGPVNCDRQVNGASHISCKLQLTEERKTVEIFFESSDFVKNLQEKFIFNADFGLGRDAGEVFAVVRLPEGTAITQNIDLGQPILPKTDRISSDGRRIIVIWRQTNVTAADPLKFQVIYEPTVPNLFGTPSLRLLALLALIIIGGIAFVIIKRFKKTKEVVLSVLDNYEKQVMSSIEAAGGKINQKKIVQDTNISKAKVSRVVKRLAERGIVEVERQGRTNIVKFSKKKLGIS